MRRETGGRGAWARIIAVGLALAGLALGCSPAGGGAGTSPAAAGGLTIQPGHWRTTVTVTEATMPGMSPERAMQMMPGPVVVEECRLSDDPRVAADEWTQAGMVCAIGEYVVTGDTFDWRRTCTTEGITLNLHVAATVTPTRIVGRIESNGQTLLGANSQYADVVDERLGDCPP